MARGLGMTTDEWLDLRSKVDDSFWVMRIIGQHLAHPTNTLDKQMTHTHTRIGYPPLPSDHDGFSCGAHKCVHPFLFLCFFLTQTVPFVRDYGCLT